MATTNPQVLTFLTESADSKYGRPLINFKSSLDYRRAEAGGLLQVTGQPGLHMSSRPDRAINET